MIASWQGRDLPIVSICINYSLPFGGDMAPRIMVDPFKPPTEFLGISVELVQLVLGLCWVWVDRRGQMIYDKLVILCVRH